MSCDIAHVHWQTSGFDSDLNEENFEEGTSEISDDLGGFLCRQEKKHAFFRVNMTGEAHALLNGVVLALAYMETSTHPECISVPPLRYIINLTGKIVYKSIGG